MRISKALILFVIFLFTMFTVAGTYSIYTADTRHEQNLNLAISMHDRAEMINHMHRIFKENESLGNELMTKGIVILNFYDSVGDETPHVRASKNGLVLFRNVESTFEHSDRVKIFTSIPYGMPVNAIYGSGFEPRINPFTWRWQHHDGIDLFNQYGVPIYATANGTVVNAGWGGMYYGGYGICVVIDTGFYYVLYGHMLRTNVRYGQKITRGMLLGVIGSTGESTGPHLHYEIRSDLFDAIDTNQFDLKCSKGEVCRNSFGK